MSMNKLLVMNIISSGTDLKSAIICTWASAHDRHKMIWWKLYEFHWIYIESTLNRKKWNQRKRLCCQRQTSQNGPRRYIWKVRTVRILPRSLHQQSKEVFLGKEWKREIYCDRSCQGAKSLFKDCFSFMKFLSCISYTVYAKNGSKSVMKSIKGNLVFFTSF